MSQVEALVESFLKAARYSSSSVMMVSIHSKDVEKLCEKPHPAFPCVLERFEKLGPSHNEDELRVQTAHAVLLRRLGVCLGAPAPDYKLDDQQRWLDWGRKILQHITPRPKK